MGLPVAAEQIGLQVVLDCIIGRRNNLNELELPPDTPDIVAVCLQGLKDRHQV